MAFGSVTLVPGVNSERTPTLLRAGYATSSLIRFRDGLVQKLGGWAKFFPFSVAGVPRDLHAWEDLNQALHLAVGTTTQLGVITSGTLKDITPQILISDFTPNFSTTINSPIVGITDPNISNVTLNDSVFFNVPVSVGGLILDGLYAITLITGTHSYQITAAKNATATSSVDSIPIFTTTNGNAIVSVAFTAHGVSTGNTVVFQISTTGNGVTIQGSYAVVSVADANHFSITVATQATASSSITMNGGNAELAYYIALGPPPIGTGFGLGGFGLGGFGTGVLTTSQTGPEITATDWTSDNWGELLLANPKGGGIYYWDPTGGFQNAQVISTAPPFNNGIFVSMSQQILVAYGSSVHEAIGFQKQPLLVQWTDVSNFFNWTVSAATQAGNFTIPIGSEIRAGIAASNQNLLWTDLDLWAMTYVGPPLVYGFNKIGAGAGAASSHAIQQFRGSFFWMGATNFYSYSSGGVSVVPCPVWDQVFQNLNTSFLQNIRAMPNTPYNEVGWFYPSAASISGECDSYVKFNVTEAGAPWDYGPAGALPRSAWIDQTVLGMPIGASPQGIIYQHETTPNADGQPLVSSFTTGFFYLAEGEDFAFVDQILPDFKWNTVTGGASAQIMMTFNVTNYPGDTPVSYGPFTVTQATEFISIRFRGRLMSITVQSADLGSWWRLGSCKYRYSTAGRR
jgi:hypothetical protein